MMKTGKILCVVNVIISFCFLLCCMSVQAAGNEDADEMVSTIRHYFGSAVYAGNGDGYKKKELIDKDNPHYGWNIGDFYVSGFTRIKDEESENPVILKNVGDTVKLSFVLNQDIDKLNKKDGISIESDDDGYDEYFGIKKTDFGRGMLIIRKTDYQGKKEEPVLHKNYLKGVKLNADTEVTLCEEGDYEIALDYEIGIEKSWYDYVQLWNQYTYDYRIFFKFSVRNGNCMIYPRDVSTTSELTNTSITENGFYIDFAKSRYLDVDIKKETLNQAENGLIEDTRFNQPAADGEQYTDEGVYTITAKNKYTDQSTEKVIYVGANNFLKAYVTSKLSLDEIKNQIDNGATVNDDGTLDYTSYNTSSNENPVTDISLSKSRNNEKRINIKIVFGKMFNYAKNHKKISLIVSGIIFIVILVLILIIRRKVKKVREKRRIQKEKKKKKAQSNKQSENDVFVEKGNDIEQSASQIQDRGGGE